MRPTSDFDRITLNIAIWHVYDSAVKSELYSTCLTTPDSSYLIDPIPLRSEALGELIGSSRVAAIIVTNSNDHRDSAEFGKQFWVPVFAHGETFSDKHHAPSEKSRTATRFAAGCARFASKAQHRVKLLCITRRTAGRSSWATR
jgi:hypothetical protein